MKKRFLSLTLAMLMVISMLSTSAFALETEDTSKEAYSITVDAELISTYASQDMTQTATTSMGLVLAPGGSGWSTVAKVNFRTLPANAVIESVVVKPGTASVNANTGFLGLVLASRLEIADPSGRSTQVTWDASSMRTAAFNGLTGEQGTWTLSFYGTNLSSGDMLFTGSTIYKSPQVTITYHLG